MYPVVSLCLIIFVILSLQFSMAVIQAVTICVNSLVLIAVSSGVQGLATSGSVTRLHVFSDCLGKWRLIPNQANTASGKISDLRCL